MLILFWLFAGIVVYAYAGYPVFVWLAAHVFGRREAPPIVADDELPRLTVLIAAHNEGAVIEERIRNALTLDYPADKLEIVVASDGSSDDTADVVRGFVHRGVRLLDYPFNRGKSATLNAAWHEVSGDVVMLSDANTWFDPRAARLLARWFALRDVGAVCGRLELIDAATGRNVDGLYWRYETLIKRCEGRLGSLLGANGAIYAVRRDRFVSVPPQTIIDDLVIPLLARMTHGCRLVYEPQAHAREETPFRLSDEFGRRARIGAGGFQCLALLWPLLNPRQGWLAFSFFSHKLLRWVTPFCLLGMLAASVGATAQPFGRVLLAAQAAFYVLAVVGALLPGRRPAVRLLRLTTLFSYMNLALLAGFWRWVRGRQRGAWARTARIPTRLPHPVTGFTEAAGKANPAAAGVPHTQFPSRALDTPVGAA